MKKFFSRGIIFIIVLSVVLTITNNIFVKKVGHRAKLYQGLYNDNNSYDVLLMGSSHMNSSINPNILWGKYGITSFNYGTGGQPIDVTYYLLKEALKTKNPKVVVVDLYYLGMVTEYAAEGYIRYVIDNMKLSLNKISAINNTTPKEERWYYYFQLAKYHSRWGELTEEDFVYDYDLGAYTKGFAAGREIYGEENKGNLNVEEIGEIPAKSLEYLYKIISLSKEYDFQLVFTNAPYDYSSTDGYDTWIEDDAAMFNKVEVIAKENNIDFLNYSSKEMMDKIDFDFALDMYNAGHMNIWGATKVSENFADFLNENYDLEDYRGDNNYKQWDNDYQRYLEDLPK